MSRQRLIPWRSFVAALTLVGLIPGGEASCQTYAVVSLTPPAGPAPRINGPTVFGVRSGSPFLYAISATGTRPMTFAADGLPAGLQLDPANGHITGSLAKPGTFQVILRAGNAVGDATKLFRIVVGEDIALTPPMGWNSWNCWHGGVDQDKVLRSARALVKFGLDQHGWTYINIDDVWQGRRGGPFNAIQPDARKFPDIQRLSDQIHGLGLKMGIYSTPWETSYGGRPGSSSANPDGAWDPATMTKGPMEKNILPYAIGPYHFFTNDANQWAAWGIDYLKFDWGPNQLPETKEMYEALRASGRDIVFSISNNYTHTLFDRISDVSPYCNSWRIGGDIEDSWPSVWSHGFQDDEWAPFARPGHWNDPDMFEIGANGGGAPKKLTPDEQYAHVSQWCLLSAPLLLGCDLEHLDAFTVGLLSNDEVLDVDQDSLGKQAVRVGGTGEGYVYAKPMQDGSEAVGLFNHGAVPATVTVNWTDLGRKGRYRVRDLWRQQDLGEFEDNFSATVAPHGVVLVRIFAATAK